MALPNIFSAAVAANVIDRIHQLSPVSKAHWGKMSVSQMLAHCNVTYEMVYDNKHPKPNFFARLLLSAFVKKGVVSEMPYKQNSPTAPAFKVKNDKDFEAEKGRLINYINKTRDAGVEHFEQKESLSFGKLSASEWNNLFYKHLDHHLRQFGV